MITHLVDMAERHRRAIAVSVVIAAIVGLIALAFGRSESHGSAPSGEPVKMIDLFDPDAGGGGERRP